jgi:hypothetical protein
VSAYLKENNNSVGLDLRVLDRQIKKKFHKRAPFQVLNIGLAYIPDDGYPAEQIARGKKRESTDQTINKARAKSKIQGREMKEAAR